MKIHRNFTRCFWISQNLWKFAEISENWWNFGSILLIFCEFLVQLLACLVLPPLVVDSGEKSRSDKPHGKPAANGRVAAEGLHNVGGYVLVNSQPSPKLTKCRIHSPIFYELMTNLASKLKVVRPNSSEFFRTRQNVPEFVKILRNSSKSEKFSWNFDEISTKKWRKL